MSLVAESDGQRYVRRAQFLWPRLDPAKLRRTHGEPQRIARLVAQRTALPAEAIVGVLLADDPRPVQPDSGTASTPSGEEPDRGMLPALTSVGCSGERASGAADATTASRLVPLGPGQLR